MANAKTPNEMDAFRDLLGRATEKQTGSRFVLDKEKYPDVEETPYGFYYNVRLPNGQMRTITDATQQLMTFMDGHPKPTSDQGFFADIDGDESWYPDWESAYKAAKGIK